MPAYDVRKNHKLVQECPCFRCTVEALQRCVDDGEVCDSFLQYLEIVLLVVDKR